VNLLSSIYGGALALKNAAYDRGCRHTSRLTGPVISVGNLSVGGAGKTPFVILLAEMLGQQGVKCDVLSRGYGRRTRGVRLVDPNGSAADFGDEPLLIARRLQVPVVVGEDRFAAGQFAEAALGPQLHILDDGFQHRQVARDFDIVMLGPGDTRDRLLPAGRLREPLRALSRADAVVVEGESPAPTEAVGKVLWRIRRGIELADVPAHPIVFCGIARPERFLEQLRARGVNTATTRIFSDHHAYTEADVSSLVALKAQSGSTAYVTTEKDVVNLGSLAASLESLVVARVTMELMNASPAIDAMLEMVNKRRQRS